MLTKTEKSTSAVTTYTYNPENQLTKMAFPDGTFASYRYDGLGRRIEKNLNGNITQYYYDNEDIILETDAGQNILAHYTHGPGIDEPLTMERDGESYYYLSDGLGSITTVTDSSQDIINSYIYDSFGNIVEQTGSLPNPYTYTGREYDSESNLYYYRARYYDPRIGRFLSEDPAGFFGSFNLYTYVGNNPINFVDPYGLVGPTGKIIKNVLKWILKKVADKVGSGIVKRVIERILNRELPPLSPEDIFLEPTEIDDAGEGDYDNNGIPDFGDDWDDDGIPNYRDDSDGDGEWDYEDEDMREKIKEEGKGKKQRGGR